MASRGAVGRASLVTSRVIEVEVGETRREITIEPLSGSAGPHQFRVTFDGVTRVVDARRVDDETLSFVYLEGGGASHQAVVLEAAGSEGAELDVHLHGAVLKATVDRGRSWVDDGGANAEGGNQLTAPMPGKVVRILVQEGDTVEAKQPVVVVEAMKMENEIAAPRAGRVASVRVSEGASVDPGAVLVVID